MSSTRGVVRAPRSERPLAARRHNRLGLLAASLSLAGGLVGGMLSLAAGIGADAKQQQISIDQANDKRNRTLVAEVDAYNATHPARKAMVLGTAPPSEMLTSADVTASHNLATGAGWAAIIGLATGTPLALRSLRRQQELQDREETSTHTYRASTGHWRAGAEPHHLPPRRLEGTTIYMSHSRYRTPFSAGNVSERCLTTTPELAKRRTTADQGLLSAAVQLHLTPAA